MRRIPLIIGIVLIITLLSAGLSVADHAKTRIVTDSLGREVVIPDDVPTVICSGAGGLRYLTYLNAENNIIGVDSIDAGEPAGRPYAITHTEFQNLPVIGDFKGSGHGSDNLEAIIALHPDLIIKTYDTPENIAKEEEKLGIPILYLEYGDLGANKDKFYDSLRILGNVMHKGDRAEAVIQFFEDQGRDLSSRTSQIPDEKRPSAYVGGVGYYGAMGIESTEPGYPPFILTNVRNVASDMGSEHAEVSTEKLLDWDPEYFFLDLGCKDVSDLNRSTVFPLLSAVQNKRVYGLLPYNSYTTDQDTVLADAYFIGTVLYPDQFSDVDSKKKADEIYQFLDGKAVFDTLNMRYGKKAFSQIV